MFGFVFFTVFIESFVEFSKSIGNSFSRGLAKVIRTFVAALARTLRDQLLDVLVGLETFRFQPSLYRWECLSRQEGICVDPPLCRGTSQVKCGSRIADLVCVGGTVGKMGEVDEMGERERVLVVSVRCGKEGDMTRG